jgi:pectate lyase-like protein
LRRSIEGNPLNLDKTGATDVSGAIQTALNDAKPENSPPGRGVVVLAPGRYLVEEPLTIPAGVTLCGTSPGPFDVVGINPGPGSTHTGKTIAATLLIPDVFQGTPDAFITLDGQGSGVTDILFHYPDQVVPVVSTEESAPDVYPFTVHMKNASTKIERCTVTNAYEFLLISSGRAIARDLNIGAFAVGIYVDGPADHVTITNTIHSVFWDIYANVEYFKSQLSRWTAKYGYGFLVYRADHVVIENTLVMFRYAGFFTGASPEPGAQAPFSGWGTVTDLMCDRCQYGIIASSTEPTGYQFSNLQLVPNDTYGGRRAVAYLAPPPNPEIHKPIILLNGGCIRTDVFGGWDEVLDNFPAPAKLFHDNMIGVDLL